MNDLTLQSTTDDRMLRASLCGPEPHRVNGRFVLLYPPAALPLGSALRLQNLRLAQQMEMERSLRESVWLVTGRCDEVWRWPVTDVADAFAAWQKLAERRPSLAPGVDRGRSGDGGARARNPYTMLLADLMHCYGGAVMDWLDCPAGLAIELGFEVGRLTAADIKADLDAGIAAQGHQMRRGDYQQFVKALRRAMMEGAAIEPLSPETNLRNAELIGFRVIRTEAGDDHDHD